MLAVSFSSELAIYNVDLGQSRGTWEKKKKTTAVHTTESGWF